MSASKILLKPSIYMAGPNRVLCENCPPGIRKSYTGKEPSPNGLGWSASFESPGTVRTGLDRRQWKVVALKKSRVWRPVTASISVPAPGSEASKHYYIHWNGGCPFVVYVYRDRYELYESEALGRNEDHSGSVSEEWGRWYRRGGLLLSGPYKRGLPGQDNLFGGNQPAHEGNTVLIECPSGEYLYIGGTMLYRFRPTETISEFCSPIGNNDFPYPYAISKTFCYIMEYQVCFPKRVMPKDYDPVEYYLENFHTYDPEEPTIANTFAATSLVIPVERYSLDIPFDKLPKTDVKRLSQLPLREPYRIYVKRSVGPVLVINAVLTAKHKNETTIFTITGGHEQLRRIDQAETGKVRVGV